MHVWYRQVVIFDSKSFRDTRKKEPRFYMQNRLSLNVWEWCLEFLDIFTCVESIIRLCHFAKKYVQKRLNVPIPMYMQIVRGLSDQPPVYLYSLSAQEGKLLFCVSQQSLIDKCKRHFQSSRKLQLPNKRCVCCNNT